MNGICNDVAWIIFCLYGIYSGKKGKCTGSWELGACVAMTAAGAFVRLLLLRMPAVWHCINVLPFN